MLRDRLGVKLIPDSKTLRKALLEVLIENPAGLSTLEIDERVATKLDLSDEDVKKIRTGNRTEFSYRMSWERTHAKARGEVVRVSARFWKST
jgi:restriction endonuclease Mrr